MNKPKERDCPAIIPVDERVMEKMTRFLMLNTMFGSPASRAYYPEWREEAAIEVARRLIAEMVGAEPREIIFTFGSTEANNLVIKQAATFYQKKGSHIVIARTGNNAALALCRELEHAGYVITRLMPRDNGLVDISELKSAICKETALVSIGQVNQDSNVIQHVAEVGGICRRRGVLFHVDATQCIGSLPVNVHQQPVDLMSFSSNSLSGPQGVGALYIRCDPRVGIRYGDCGPAYKIVGMGEAYRIAGLNRGRVNQ